MTNQNETKLSRIELRLETSLLSEIDELLDGRSRSEWIRRACREKVEQEKYRQFVDSLFREGDQNLKPIAERYLDTDDL